LILVLCAQGSDPEIDEGETHGGVLRRPLADLEQVLDWLGTGSFSRVVLPWPSPGFNPFALARRLRLGGRTQVVLVGELANRTRFWAERNGCLVSRSTQDALALEELA
jgi:hypothetical protein